MACEYLDIKIIFCDVDGVLTDGGMYWMKDGLVMKKFNTRDSTALHRFQKKGIPVIFITSSRDKLTFERLTAIGTESGHIQMGWVNKWEFVSNYLHQAGIPFNRAIFIGDDYNDLLCIRNLIGACPKDAVQGVIEIAQIIINRNGGEGVLAGLADILMEFDDTNCPEELNEYSTAGSLLKYAGTWKGDDAEKIFKEIRESRTKTEF